MFKNYLTSAWRNILKNKIYAAINIIGLVVGLSVYVFSSLLATYEDMAEMIRLGAYRPGSDPATDEAIAYHDKLETFLSQEPHERTDLATGYAELTAILADGAS